jgi:hypothetical protein
MANTEKMQEKQQNLVAPEIRKYTENHMQILAGLPQNHESHEKQRATEKRSQTLEKTKET